MDKNLLKRIRKWSKYHQNVTALEAYRHLDTHFLPPFEREKLHRFDQVRAPIETYLINYCGFKKTRKKRENQMILESSAPTVEVRRISRNYYDLLRSLVEEDFSI